MLSVFINRTRDDAPYTFENLVALQEEQLVKGFPSVLFAEVNPVVTLGTRQLHGQDPRHQDVLNFTAQLNAQGISVLPGERGGNETWHGPGQWVCFPVMRLEDFSGDPKGVRKAVHLILEKILPVIVTYQRSAHIEWDDRLGIWSDIGKLASIGIKVRQGPDRRPWITSGFAINCFRTRTSFIGINPCGIGAAIPDFLFQGADAVMKVQETDMEREFNSLPDKLTKALLA